MFEVNFPCHFFSMKNVFKHLQNRLTCSMGFVTLETVEVMVTDHRYLLRTSKGQQATLFMLRPFWN